MKAVSSDISCGNNGTETILMGKFEIIKTYYENNMSKGLPEYGILGWESEEAQRLRFDVLLDSVRLDGKSVLDVGCGTGNLFEYILSKGLRVKYTGVDILGRMIEKAKSKGLDANFYHVDIFKNNIFKDYSFDVIYASGIFNLNLGNNKDFLMKALDLFFRLSEEAVVFNLLHFASPDREKQYYYFHPDEVVKMIGGFSDKVKKVKIIEAYLKNDFTVACTLNERS